MPIDYLVIVAADDCTSVQAFRSRADTAQKAAICVFEQQGEQFARQFRLIAAISDDGDVHLRDDARTAEFGLEEL